MRKLFTIAICVFIAGATLAQTTNEKKNDAKEEKKLMKAEQLEFYNYKWTKKQIELEYEKMEEAQKNLDIDLMLSLTHPGYTAIMPNGSTVDFTWLKNYWAAGLQQVKSTESLRNGIQQFKLNGDTAVVIVHQQWKRKQIKADTLRDVQTEAVQTETWVKTNEGWKRFRVENIHDQIFYVDNKRVDPSKPYDPAAPPFVPTK
jgi:predicted HNH restriction endonuclease